MNRLELRKLEREAEERGLELLDSHRAWYRCMECGQVFSLNAGEEAELERQKHGTEWWYCPGPYRCNWPDED